MNKKARMRSYTDDKVCPVCEKQYHRHPFEKTFPIAMSMWEDPNKPTYMYRRLCTNELVLA
jgi:hypothetical protein